ncbi:MAG: M1 family peptidase [Sphingobacteriales bacterium]|nr:MAG: M1 family peptidase [Sphingobacteriales bacterium]
MKRTALSAALFLLPCLVSAQNYWQQLVNTRIDVTLDDKKHILHGYEEFDYTNNSTDTLTYIYIHLWPNAYLHDHTQLAEQMYRNGHKAIYYAKPSERGYIDSLDFTVNGKSALYFNTESLPDVARIDLPDALVPGATMKIATPFRVKLPKVFSRLGHTKQSYFISQWFPKPAVYDKKGWHPIPYLDLGEFYSEIGSYDVTITLPSNYIVMGTGNILDDRENQWLDSLAGLPITDWQTKAGKADSTPPSSTEMKTIRFHEDNIHDFAWFADKRWVVRKDTVSSPGTNALVTTWSAYLPAYDKSWKLGNKHLADAVKYYGKWVGPYPYKTIKAVQGDMKAGGGMEYPTVTIIDRASGGDPMTIIHEAGHNWFYGILASNERDHAWMDEGLNTFYEQKTTAAVKEARQKDSAASTATGMAMEAEMIAVMHQLAASGRGKAIEQTSVNFPEINYGLDVYYKTAALLSYLEAYMGEASFEAGMHDYYNTWKHKHPYPEDFRAALQRHTDKSLDWFFTEALQNERVIDFSVKKVTNTDSGPLVTVVNKSGHNLMPPGISVYNDNDSLLLTSFLPAEKSHDRIYHFKLPSNLENWSRIRIAPSVTDGMTHNNEYRRGGLFHRSGIKISMIPGVNLANRHKLFILPALGYNMYDGFQAGLLLHNLTWPQNRFRYTIAPLYGFSSKELNGAASIGYNWHPTGFVKEVMIQADIKSFNYQKTERNIPEPLFARFVKIAPSLQLTLRNANPLSAVRRTVTLKAFSIREEGFRFALDASDSLFKPGIIEETNTYGLLRYHHINARPFNPFNYSFEGQLGEHFARLQMEGNLKIDYHKAGKGLHIRAFAGKYISIKEESFVSDRYHLNTTFTGPNDYLYEDTYIGRSEREGFGSRQVSIRDGGFKIPTPLYSSPLGRSDNWLAAVNIKTDLPFRLPLRLFFDIGSFANADKLNPSGNKMLFDGGVEFHLYDIVNVYLPLVMSKDFKDYRNSIQGDNNLLKGIVFSVQLQKINWLKAPSGVLKILGF